MDESVGRAADEPEVDDPVRNEIFSKGLAIND
jgi:hypothetical protein